MQVGFRGRQLWRLPTEAEKNTDRSVREQFLTELPSYVELNDWISVSNGISPRFYLNKIGVTKVFHTEKLREWIPSSAPGADISRLQPNGQELEKFDRQAAEVSESVA